MAQSISFIPPANQIPFAAGAFDGVMNIGNGAYSGAPLGGIYNMEIYPGSDETLASVMSCNAGYYAGTHVFNQAMCWNAVNPEATVTPTPARVNLIRLLPYGSGAVNPPEPGHTFTCQYSLSGVPAS
jgi:hypothetical protein